MASRKRPNWSRRLPRPLVIPGVMTRRTRRRRPAALTPHILSEIIDRRGLTMFHVFFEPTNNELKHRESKGFILEVELCFALTHLIDLAIVHANDRRCSLSVACKNANFAQHRTRLYHLADL